MTAFADIDSMAFFDSNLFGNSYGFAQRFAGEDGHIATMPEIITARAKHSEESYMWRSWFTSASSEYFGRSKGGVPIVIVAHGNGPMVGVTAIEEYYQPLELRPNGRPLGNGEGHISLEEFRLLENGHYGDVTIVEVSRLDDIYPYPFMSAADMSQAERDPLLHARLGPDWYAALEIMQQVSYRNNVKYTGPAPKVFANEGPTVYYLDDDKGPYAHLLCVGAAVNYHRSSADGGESVSFDVDCHTRSFSKRFIGVRANGDVATTHPGPSMLDYNEELLLINNPLPPGDDGFFVLKQFGDEWFTQTRKVGEAMDTGWPEFAVAELVKVGAPGKIVAMEETMFFRYDIDTVISQAPKGANAYYRSSGLRSTLVDGVEALEADIVFCSVVLDESKKIPDKEWLKTDYDLQMKLLERVVSASNG